MRVEPLSVGEVEYVAHALAADWFGDDEPIPEFSTRYPDRLESCLQQPFVELMGLDPYPGLAAKASILFYLMTKNHPFMNGNKRLAVTTILNLLAKNGKWLKASPEALYRIARKVASSDPREKDVVVKALELFIVKNMIEFASET